MCASTYNGFDQCLNGVNLSILENIYRISESLGRALRLNDNDISAVSNYAYVIVGSYPLLDLDGLIRAVYHVYLARSGKLNYEARKTLASNSTAWFSLVPLVERFIIQNCGT